MNGQSTVNPSTNSNEQLIGKFHVVNVDKLPINSVNSHEETTVAATAGATGAAVPPVQAPPSSTADESACASRFQMIRVDRNFARGRWKVNDYEPPENTSTSINPPVNTIENDPVNISSSTTLTSAPITTAAPALPNNAPPGLPVDSTATSSATLAATAASAAAAAATAFQQQRLVLNNPAANVMPPANIPPPAGLLHAYPPNTLPNIAAANQSYLLPNHHIGYYPFFPSHYAPYPHQWAPMPPANPYLPPPHPHPHQQQQATQPPPGNLGDGIRYGDTVVDVPNENPVISSTQFSNPATDHLQNAQMAAAAAAAAGPFLYPAHHAYVPQAPPTNASPYATVASYHPASSLPTIIPPHQQPLSLAQPPPTNAADPSLTSQQPQLHQAPPIQQQQQQQQPAPILTSPKHDASSTKTSVQPATAPKPAVASVPTNLPKPLTTAANGANNDALRAVPNSTQITDLLSSSPSVLNSQPPPSLLSPITVQTNNAAKTPTASLNDIWTYAAGGSPLNVSQTAAQTAAVTAVAAMGLLSNESAKNNEIANEILKELTTPTKQNNTTDIDNKISAAMDLVKMHLLSAVREEVTDLRQQIRILNEKVTSVEHENAYLRQHVPSEIYAQYTPLFVGTSTANDSSNSTTNPTTATAAPPVPLSSSQPIPSAAAASLPSSIAQQASASTTSQVPTLPPPPASINLPPT